ncbi:hypothetical protein HDE_01790 [Halotydeus destructor]|nr:hypothetical protein HDE_01790 [Halotydeus destructor]
MSSESENEMICATNKYLEENFENESSSDRGNDCEVSQSSSHLKSNRISNDAISVDLDDLSDDCYVTENKSDGDETEVNFVNAISDEVKEQMLEIDLSAETINGLADEQSNAMSGAMNPFLVNLKLKLGEQFDLLPISVQDAIAESLESANERIRELEQDGVFKRPSNYIWRHQLYALAKNMRRGNTWNCVLACGSSFTSEKNAVRHVYEGGCSCDPNKQWRRLNHPLCNADEVGGKFQRVPVPEVVQIPEVGLDYEIVGSPSDSIKMTLRRKPIVIEDDSDVSDQAHVVEEYEVEQVLGRSKKHLNKFWIRWKNYSATDDTVEPVENLDCPELLQAFYINEKNMGGLICYRPKSGKLVILPKPLEYFDAPPYNSL